MTSEINDQKAQNAEDFIKQVFAESRKQGINQKYSGMVKMYLKIHLYLNILVYFNKTYNTWVYESEDFTNRQKRQVSSSENTSPLPNSGNHDEVQLVQNPIEAMR